MQAKRFIPLVVGATSIATLTSTLLLTGLGVSASTPGGLVHVYDVNTSSTGGPGSVVVTGAIADWGMDQQGVSPTANRIVLSKGTFEVDTSAIQKKFSTTKPKGNPANCGVVLAATAPAKVFDGTGAYKGITGTVTLHIESAAVLPRTSSGKCDESPNSVALGEVTISQGSGTVSLG